MIIDGTKTNAKGMSKGETRRRKKRKGKKNNSINQLSTKMKEIHREELMKESQEARNSEMVYLQGSSMKKGS